MACSRCAGTEYLGDTTDWAKQKLACLKKAAADLGVQAAITIPRCRCGSGLSMKPNVRVMPRSKLDLKRWQEIQDEIERKCGL